jgi:hypothetical protein
MRRSTRLPGTRRVRNRGRAICEHTAGTAIQAQRSPSLPPASRNRWLVIYAGLVGDGAGDFEDAVIGAGTEMQILHGFFQTGQRCRIQCTKLLDCTMLLSDRLLY